MITEAKQRGQRIMLLGVILAVLSALMTWSAIQSAQPKTTVARHPFVLLAQRVPANTSMKSAISGEVVADLTATQGVAESKALCPDPSLPSLAVGAFMLCLPGNLQTTAPDGVTLEMVDEEQLAQSDPRIRQKVINLATYELLQLLGETYALADLPPGLPLQIDLVQHYPTIGQGMRAVAIPVGPASNVGNRVSQGDRVDIVVTYERQIEGNSVPVTEVMFQDVEVLAASDSQRFFGPIPTAQRFGEREITPVSIVTLKMSLESAKQLIHISNLAQDLRLVLRETDDHDVEEIAPTIGATS